MKFLRTPIWRALLTVMLLASIPLLVLQNTLIPKMGDLGFDSVIEGWTGTVTDIRPHSSAWSAGIRKGDLIVVPQSERVKFISLLAGDRLQLKVRRGNVFRTVEFTVAPRQLHFDVATGIRAGTNLCLLIFSLLILARAWNTEFGPLIAACLTSVVYNAAADRIPYFTNSGWLGVVLPYLIRVIGDGAVYGVYVSLLVPLCAAVAGRMSRTLRFLLWASVASVVGYSVVQVANVAGYYLTLPDAVYNLLYAYGWTVICLPVPALIAALIAARQEYRSRMLWLFWGFFPNALGIALADLSLLWFIPPTFLNDPLVQTVARALELSLPVALFYGLLVRRTIDLGFVVNRVAVFGLISAVVLGIFVLLEYLVGQFVEAHGAASWAIQLGIALVIGVSARFLHSFVDRFVDRVFFAKRHADEMALKRFAQEAEAFTSAEALLDRALEAINKHSETRGAAIYLCGEREAELVGGKDYPRAIDIDDPLLVALRRWNEPVDTHDAKTAFPDGMVFPMSARGKLIGALACRTKRDATAFAPDEREPLLEVARATARALDALGTKSADTFGALGQTMLAMLVSIQEAVSSLKAERAVDGEIHA